MNRPIAHCLMLYGFVVLMMPMGRMASADKADPYDRFCDDDTTASLNVLHLNFDQDHTLDNPQDVDWMRFTAESGMPYSIKLREVGADLRLRLEVYHDGLDAPPMTVFSPAPGEDLIYSRTNWPNDGPCWFCVSAIGETGESCDYNVVVTCNTGANLGLATISGTSHGYVAPGGGSLSLPETVSSETGPIEPLYQYSGFSYGSGAFELKSEPMLKFGGLNDFMHHLEAPWLVQWAHPETGRFPGNYTLVSICTDPLLQVTEPIRLTIQMRDEPLTKDLYDANGRCWPGVTFLDIPEGVQPADVVIYRWNVAQERWDPFDLDPDVSDCGSGWLARTWIDRFRGDFYAGDLFGAAVCPDGEAPPNEAWVDLAHGLRELGTRDFPFDTAGEGIRGVADGGTVHFADGVTSETFYIDRPMRLEATAGSIRLGVPPVTTNSPLIKPGQPLGVAVRWTLFR